MGNEQKVWVTKMGGGGRVGVDWKSGMDAGTAVLNAGFSTEGASLNVNGSGGTLETPVQPGDSVVVAAKAQNG